jgi:hypothetical protein
MKLNSIAAGIFDFAGQYVLGAIVTIARFQDRLPNPCALAGVRFTQSDYQRWIGRLQMTSHC